MGADPWYISRERRNLDTTADTQERRPMTTSHPRDLLLRAARVTLAATGL